MWENFNGILRHIRNFDSYHYLSIIGRRGRLSSNVNPRARIDSAGSLPVGVDRRGNSFRSERTSGRLLRGPSNASGSDMTDDSLSVVSAPPGPLANK